MDSIIGRKQQKEYLGSLYRSKSAQFVVVYGRRRVGKSYLVNEYFNGRFAFNHSGLSPIDTEDTKILEKQLRSFASSLRKYGYDTDARTPKDWLDAFDMLIELMESKMVGTDDKQVVFLDELPWMDTPRSGFVTAFEHFWNGWGASHRNLMLIVCGSATSWLNDKLINNHGGLFNRVTAEIYLEPFTLSECEEYYKTLGISMNRYQQTVAYMVFGGVPYYLSLMRKKFSLAQNIDFLVFSKRAPLRNEFERLFESLFVSPDDYKKIAVTLSQKREGYTRKEIAQKTGIPYGGGLSKILNTLEVSNFVTSYQNYKGNAKMTYYKLTDSFVSFYLQFGYKKNPGENFFADNFASGRLSAWQGLAFEQVCFAHIRQIKRALGIASVNTVEMPWRSRNADNNAQIDMVIERADQVANICEIKFSMSDFCIDKDYDRNLRNKLQTFIDQTAPQLSLHLTLITTFGLKPNEYSGAVQSVVTMDDLFTD